MKNQKIIVLSLGASFQSFTIQVFNKFMAQTKQAYGLFKYTILKKGENLVVLTAKMVKDKCYIYFVDGYMRNVRERLCVIYLFMYIR